MDLIVHLSDLHLDESKSQATLLEALVGTLRREWKSMSPDRTALVVTGDVFDSSSSDVRAGAKKFAALHEDIVRALGGLVPTIVLPGNHDRRRRGLIGPNDERPFLALKSAMDPACVHVAGCRTPFLAEVVPRAMHGLEADVIAYDSTFLPKGLIGAGGMIRREDLLQAFSRVSDSPSETPLIFLIHHHLVPTPLTDVSRIDANGSARVTRWMLGTALPALISNADHEELTMTALGAGTALSMLHSFGRPVLLLHGHKHFPTARLLRGLNRGSGDVLLASAGSAGRRERVHADRHPDDARLWPSFNLVAMDGPAIKVQALSFHPRRGDRPVTRRDLLDGERSGIGWKTEPVSARAQVDALRLTLDEAHFELRPSREAPEHRFDFVCSRRLELAPGAKLKRYIEIVHALPRGSKVRGARGREGRRKIDLLIGDTRYEVLQGLCRSRREARRSYGAGTAFEWVGLMSRYGGALVRLTLSRASMGAVVPFGSATDLSTGRERPLAVETTAKRFEVTVRDCSPRTLLKLYWPLES